MKPTATPGTHRRRRGFTLVELLVAVSILVIMLMSFGQIISQSQTLVTRCQQIMRLNTTASIIGQLLQRDLLSISKEGYLYLGLDGITFARVANHQSVLDPSINANAAVVKYYRDASQGTGSVAGIGRQAMLLTGTGGASAGDTQPKTLSNATYNFTPVQLPKPGQVIGADASTYWTYLAAGCTRFDSYGWVAGATTWTQGTYSNSSPTAWPLAIRIRFGLKDGSSSQEYELMADLP